MGHIQLFKPGSRHRQNDLVLLESAQNRLQAQEFIRDQFRREHNAHLRHFARHLVALTDTQHLIQACVGFQGAHESPLFLEQYLDQPIEQLLSLLEGKPVQRRAILEVGNLASRYSGCTRRIILSLGHYFLSQGYQWLVITATPRILNSFSKLGVGLELIPLSPARPERLGAAAADWGNYYELEPQVVAGRFHHGLQRLISNPLLRRLMRRAPQLSSDRHILLAREVA
ncbi:MAG TPA: thermostable hemolysin [Motiliproteus sp.]